LIWATHYFWKTLQQPREGRMNRGGGKVTEAKHRLRPRPTFNEPSFGTHPPITHRLLACSASSIPEARMFDVLVASGAHLELRARWVSTSLITHALVVTLAVLATQVAPDVPTVTAADPAILLFVPKPPPPPEVKRQPPAPSIVVAEPPPKGFQTVAALKDIPIVIPPVDLTQRPLDPRDFTGHGVEGGLAEGVVGGSGKVDATVGGLNAIYEVTTTDDRFEPAIVVFQAAPKYPKSLEVLGVEGRVTVEFVIDTTGRVQPTSIRVLESTHPDFEAAARVAVAAALFRPARLSAHPVRQLTRQSVRFMTIR
jgi:TonB family protein